MGFNDYDIPTQHRNGSPKAEEKLLVKDRECLHCKKFFDCNGKKRGVDCIGFVERPRN